MLLLVGLARAPPHNYHCTAWCWTRRTLPGGRFALIVSANHSLLDGHGFFAIYSMLSARAEVWALSPVRKQQLPATIAEAMGGGP
jgi:hypothetical protein